MTLLQYCFCFLLLLFLVFVIKFVFNWRIIALQYCVHFSQISTWISHRYTCVPSLLNLPLTSFPILPFQIVIETLFEFPESHSKFPLATYFIFGNVYVSVLCSPYIPPVLYFGLFFFWPRDMSDLSSPTRDQTYTSCPGRQSPNYWTIREVPFHPSSISAPRGSGLGTLLIFLHIPVPFLQVQIPSLHTWFPSVYLLDVLL